MKHCSGVIVDICPSVGKSVVLRGFAFQHDSKHGGSCQRFGTGHHRGCREARQSVESVTKCCQVMVSEVVCAKERMEAREAGLLVLFGWTTSIQLFIFQVEEAYQKFEESEEHIQDVVKLAS